MKKLFFSSLLIAAAFLGSLTAYEQQNQELENVTLSVGESQWNLSHAVRTEEYISLVFQSLEGHLFGNVYLGEGNEKTTREEFEETFRTLGVSDPKVEVQFEEERLVNGRTLHFSLIKSMIEEHCSKESKEVNFLVYSFPLGNMKCMITTICSAEDYENRQEELFAFMNSSSLEALILSYSQSL